MTCYYTHSNVKINIDKVHVMREIDNWSHTSNLSTICQHHETFMSDNYLPQLKRQEKWFIESGADKTFMEGGAN